MLLLLVLLLHVLVGIVSSVEFTDAGSDLVVIYDEDDDVGTYAGFGVDGDDEFGVIEPHTEGGNALAQGRGPLRFSSSSALLGATIATGAVGSAKRKAFEELSPAEKEWHSRDCPRMALIGTLDGSLHALNFTTGECLWSINGGALLDSPSQTTSNRDIAFIPDIRNGELYVAHRESKNLQKVSRTIQQLVFDTPIHSDDGHIYIGQKTSKMYAIDPATGRMRNRYLSDDDTPDNVVHASDSLLIGRTEYNIVLRKTGTSQVALNLTMAEYSPSSSITKSNFDLIPGTFSVAANPGGVEEGCVVRYASSEEGGVDQDWFKEFKSPAVAVYGADHTGRMLRLPLDDRPPSDSKFDAGLTSLHHHHLPWKQPSPDVGTLHVLQNEKGVLYTGVLLPPPPLSSLSDGPPPDTSSSSSSTTDEDEDEDSDSDTTALVGYTDLDIDLSSTPPGCYHGDMRWCTLGERTIEVEPFNVGGSLHQLALPSLIDLSHPQTPPSPSSSSAAAAAAAAASLSSLFAAASAWVYVGVLAAGAFFMSVAVWIYVRTKKLMNQARQAQSISSSQATPPTATSTSTATAATAPSSSSLSASEDDVSIHSSTSSSASSSLSKHSTTSIPSRTTSGDTHNTNNNNNNNSSNNNNNNNNNNSNNNNIVSITTATDIVVDGAGTVGKLHVTPNVLGRGSLGTVVYSGTYEGKQIAVKRMLKEYFHVADREVDLLQRSDDHPHVVRYYGMENDGQFIYIGLELCRASFVQVVEGPSITTHGTIFGADLDEEVLRSLERRRLAKEFLTGLNHLHSLSIVHRDIKPHNVLLTQSYHTVISDFGLCKLLEDDHSSFHTENVGTCGWVAPELLKKLKTKGRGVLTTTTISTPTPTRTTCAVDVFSGGCLIHYLLTGMHPFGMYYEREANIRAKKRKVETKCVVANNLIQLMIRDNPNRRVSVATALMHPYFWSCGKRLQFLMDFSDRIETETDDSQLLKDLEMDAERTLGGKDWSLIVGEEFRQDLRKFRSYDISKVVTLLRAIRNKRHHYREMPQSLKAVLGSIPEGYFNYFHSRFPYMLMHVHRLVATHCANEPLFSQYFEL